MKQTITMPQTFTRRFYAVMALVMGFTLMTTVFPTANTGAVQLQSRQIQISDSAPSSSATGVGSGKNVLYKVSFTTTNTSTPVGGIVIDFCSDSPLAGEACTGPTGFLTNKTTTTIGATSGTGTGAFAINTTDSGTDNASRIILTRATPAVLTSSVSFELGNGTSNGFTNPSTTGTFYARIYTYATASAANTHVTDASTGYLDYGGVALSTAAVITITARVQENISFCLSGVSPSANCGGATAPSVTLGEGSTPALDSTVVSKSSVYSQIATNASAGAVVRIRNSNSSCGGLSRDGGTTCGIPPVGSGASSVQTMTAGTAGFGLSISSAAGTVVSAPYSGNPASNQFGMDTTTAGSNATTTFGSQVFTTNSLPIASTNNTWTFGATPSNVTPSGIYSANIVAIATGTF
ncbi:MAG TPA: hypothetical protein VGE30_01700 [Candidatus Saccharimonadales bacterium]